YNATVFKACSPTVLAWITRHGSRFHPETIKTNWVDGFIRLDPTRYSGGWNLILLEKRKQVLHEVIKSVLREDAVVHVHFHFGDLERVNKENKGIAWTYDVLARTGLIHIGPAYIDDVHWYSNDENAEQNLSQASWQSFLLLIGNEIAREFGTASMRYHRASMRASRERHQNRSGGGVKKEEEEKKKNTVKEEKRMVPVNNKDTNSSSER